ncbi:MAG TPA: DUF5681 domain-containing protein [Gemmataceae bacterium]|nr:DUF5681 domain-containing protein [Gemmataceae bacterium]
MAADRPGGRFRQGESGNPAGRPKGTRNKVTVDAQQTAAALVDDPIYRAKLARDLRGRKVPPLIEQMLWHYAKGKPKDELQVTGSEGGPLEIVIRKPWAVNEGDGV